MFKIIWIFQSVLHVLKKSIRKVCIEVCFLQAAIREIQELIWE